MEIPPLHIKVADGIWVGNISAADDAQFIADSDITAIVNLSGRPSIENPDIDYFNYMLPSQELMAVEFPKTISKLESITSDIADLRRNGRTILIHCLDGRNKSVIAAGYYLISRCGWKPEIAIDTLEQLYFTSEQRADELEFRSSSSAVIPEGETEGVAVAVDQEAAQKRAERNAVRCLTLASFRKILRELNRRKK